MRTTNLNFIKGKQYPYGYKRWLHGLSALVYEKLDPFLWEKLDPEAWLPYFIDGHSPKEAFYLDLNEG